MPGREASGSQQPCGRGDLRALHGERGFLPGRTPGPPRAQPLAEHNYHAVLAPPQTTTPNMPCADM